MALIVVSGYMVRYPVAGSQLAYFHYLLGLSRLGHDVVYLEESGWPDSCYDPATNTQTSNPAAGLRSVRQLCDAFGLDCPIIYVDRETGATHGAPRSTVESYLAAADLWLNIGGVCMLPEVELCRRRALVDMDPMFTQVGKFGGSELDFYHAHFTYGTNIGRSVCAIPTGAIEWQPLLPPVVQDIWWDGHGAEKPDRASAPFTTVANWSAYGPMEWNGRLYGQKDQEFLRLSKLPALTSRRLLLALSGEGEAVRREFRTRGWTIVGAAELSRELDTYRQFIQGSAGEFSAAKHAYVVTRSGWFSDRSVCYLAAGLPVVVQDTGIGESLELGRGVLVFASLEEAAAAIEQVSDDYARQSRWARELAQEVFDARVVLPKLVEGALADSTTTGSRRSGRPAGDQAQGNTDDTLT